MQAPNHKTSSPPPRNYSKMPDARSSVPTHSRHNKPSPLHTLLAMLYLALASAPVAAALSLLYVGASRCKDASGIYYNNVCNSPVVDSSGNQLKGTALLDFCSSWCGQKSSGLVGVETYDGSSHSRCLCAFSDPLPTSLTIASYSSAGYGSSSAFTGIGAVTSSVGLTDYKWYSVQVRSLLFLCESPHSISQTRISSIPLFSHPQRTP